MAAGTAIACPAAIGTDGPPRPSAGWMLLEEGAAWGAPKKTS